MAAGLFYFFIGGCFSIHNLPPLPNPFSRPTGPAYTGEPVGTASQTPSLTPKAPGSTNPGPYTQTLPAASHNLR